MRPTVESILHDFEHCRSGRSNYESQWDDIARLMLPTRWFAGKQVPGIRRNVRVYNSIGARLLTRLAAAMHGLLTNQGGAWFNLRDPDERINNMRSVQLWLQDTVRRMRFVFSSQQFAFDTTAQEAYKDLCAFGNAAVLMQDSPSRGLRFQAIALNQCFFKANEYDEIDTVYREMCFSPVNAARMFGPENLSARVKQMLEDPARKYDETRYLHAATPRDVYNPYSPRSTDKPVASYYIDVDNKHMVSEGGFDRLPYLTPRWDKVAGDVYGTGPGAMELPDVAMANEAKRDTIQSFALANRPPMLTPANGMAGPLRINPGDVNTFRAGIGADALPRPLITGVNPAAGEKFLAQQHEDIKGGFYQDLLQLPDIDRPTNYDTWARMSQNMTLMGPILSRQQKEWLSPVVIGVFQYMNSNRMLLPAPQELRNRLLTIDYVSPMAMSQRASEITNMIQHMQRMLTIAQARPDVLDNYDTDEWARFDAAMGNVPQRVLRDPADRDQLRQQREQQMAQQATIANAQGMASAAKDGAKAMSDLQGSAA